MIAGVVIDDWKLPIFKRHLDAAGYKYIERPGITPSTLILKITYKGVSKLRLIVETANDECRAVNTGGVMCLLSNNSQAEK